MIDKILFFSLVVIITIAGTLLFYNFFIVLDVEEIGIDLTIGDHIGFNIDTDAIHFGTLPKGAEGKRKITIENKFDRTVRTNIKIGKDISKFISVSENNFKLKANEEKNVTFIAKAPLDEEFRMYNSTVRIFFTRIWGKFQTK